MTQKSLYNRKFLFRLLLTGSCIYLLYINIEVKSVVFQLGKIDFITILIAFFLNYIGAITMQSIITKYSSSTFSVSTWDLDKVNLAMRFYAMILPMAVVSLLRWRRYNLLGCSKSHSLVLMLLNKVLQFLIIALFFVLAFIQYSDLFADTFIDWYLPLVFSLVVLLLGLIYSLGLITGVFGSVTIFRCLAGTSMRMPRKIQAKMLKVILKIRTSIQSDHKLGGGKTLMLLIFALVSHLFILGSQYYSSAALGMELTFLELAFARSFVQLLLMFPVTVAGIGVREVGFISTLALFNVSAEAAIALSLVLLGIQVGFALLGVLVETIAIIRQKQIV